MRDFKKIIAWQLADVLAIKIYKMTRNFPKEEIYGLTSQLRRAVISVPANIAEGATRNSNKEYLRFLYIAKGSLAEVEYLLHICHHLDYLAEQDYNQLNEMRVECAKTLYGLITSVVNDK